LTLTIDKGTSNEMTMVLKPVAGSDLTVAGYIAGVTYALADTDAVSGRRLGGGQHTFQIDASDGMSSAAPYMGVGPLLLIPYFDNFRLVPWTEANAANPGTTASAVTSAVVGDQVLIVGNLSFPKNSDTNTTAPIAVDNITIELLKPDGTQLTLEASAVPVNWTGPLDLKSGYAKAKAVDAAFATGNGLTLTASGEWIVSASWPGNSVWDKADTIDREARVSVGGPMRTIAVSDPSMPADSPPIVDMITPPRIISSTDPGRIFGYERALDMRIVRWDPAIGAYFRYVSQGQFPELRPGEAIWIKPKSSYPADAITQAQVDITGLLALGNPEVTPDYTKQHRLINTFVKDYTRNTTTAKLDPCDIQLRRGWNQFGSIFVNWKKNSSGGIVLPRQDVGIPFSEVKVRYLNETKSLSEAAAAGWIRDYAWRYDAVNHRYVLVSATAAGAERVLTSWNGCWIRAFVDCVLIIDPNTSYNGTGLFSLHGESNATISKQQDELDSPPAIPE
jgi:hypothetical protein